MSSLRRPLVCSIVIAAIVALSPACAGSGTGASPDPSEIEALERQMWEHVKNRRFDAMRDRLSDDALLLGADEIIDRDAYVAAMEKGQCEVQGYTLEGVKVTTLAPTVASISYRATADGNCAGQRIPPSVHHSIWVLRDGTWVTAQHQESLSQVNSIAGNWELNLAKSKFIPADAAPRNQSRVYEIQGQQETGRHTGLDAQGKPSVIEFSASYDGKDYPYTGSPDFDTVALKRVDANTTSFTQSRAGKVVLTGTRVVSPDGKTLTITAKGT
jgi:hypothetical protein